MLSGRFYSLISKRLQLELTCPYAPPAAAASRAGLLHVCVCIMCVCRECVPFPIANRSSLRFNLPTTSFVRQTIPSLYSVDVCGAQPLEKDLTLHLNPPPPPL